MLKLGILASGNGTNAQAIMDKARAGLIDAEICLVCSNNPNAGVLERAQKAGVTSIVLQPGDFPDRESYDIALVKVFQACGTQAVALAGYMRLLSRAFLELFKGPVLNIHPAILPSFPGLRGIADTVAYGVKIGGVSVHFVDEKMDSGPLIIQAALGIDAGETAETLAPRIHALEHRIYPQALQWLCEGRLERRGRKVFLAQGRKKPSPSPAGCLIWPPLEEGF